LFGQGVCSLGNGSSQPMFAPAFWSSFRIGTVAVTVDDMIGGGAITLTGDLVCAISEFLDIASDDDFHGSFGTTVTDREPLLGLECHFHHGFTKQTPGERF
jgi:hypothetical protein